MVKYCIVPSCKRNDGERSDQLHFHRLPFTKPLQLKKWIATMNLKNNNISKYSRICSDHFAADCYMRDLKSELLGKKPRTILKEDAVPSIFNVIQNSDVPNAPLSSISVSSSNTTRSKEHGQENINQSSKCLHLSLLKKEVPEKLEEPVMDNRAEFFHQSGKCLVDAFSQTDKLTSKSVSTQTCAELLIENFYDLHNLSVIASNSMSKNRI